MWNIFAGEQGVLGDAGLWCLTQLNASSGAQCGVFFICCTSVLICCWSVASLSTCRARLLIAVRTESREAGEAVVFITADLGCSLSASLDFELLWLSSVAGGPVQCFPTGPNWCSSCWVWQLGYVLGRLLVFPLWECSVYRRIWTKIKYNCTSRWSRDLENIIHVQIGGAKIRSRNTIH